MSPCIVYTHTRAEKRYFPARTDAEKTVGHDGTTEGQGIAADIDVGPCFASHPVVGKATSDVRGSRGFERSERGFLHAEKRPFEGVKKV